MLTASKDTKTYTLLWAETIHFASAYEECMTPIHESCSKIKPGIEDTAALKFDAGYLIPPKHMKNKNF